MSDKYLTKISKNYFNIKVCEIFLTLSDASKMVLKVSSAFRIIAKFSEVYQTF